VKRIAIEEHFFAEEFLRYLRSRKDYPRLETLKIRGREMEWLQLASGCSLPSVPHLQNGLLDVGEGRLKMMDEVGVDMQVLSLSFPGVEALDPQDATSLSRESMTSSLRSSGNTRVGSPVLQRSRPRTRLQPLTNWSDRSRSLGLKEL
jgi:hypothetical protein